VDKRRDSASLVHGELGAAVPESSLAAVGDEEINEAELMRGSLELE
jgi:hypothetical protein